jgi:geranylgeranyl reductase family protein
MSKDNKMYDVIISGCGPSGSLLGYLLAGSNINTLIIEKELFPREKICAGGLQHRALKLLPFDVWPSVERVIHGIHFTYRGKNHFFRRSENPIIYTVKRSNFDNLLAGYAGNAGCNILFGEKVCGYEAVENHVDVKTGRAVYKAKILVGADGIRGFVHNKILNGKKIKKIIGYELELKGSGRTDMDLSDSVLLDFGGVRKGYCWLFPKKNSISAGMGAPSEIAGKTRNYFYKFLKEHDPEVNQSGCSQSGWRQSGMKKSGVMAQGIPIRSADTPFCGYRVLTIGDAASIGDGFTGEGLFNCFRSSYFAHSCIVDALGKSGFSFENYFERINREIYSDINASLLFTRVFYGATRFFYKLLESDSGLFDSCCGILRGDRLYSDVLKRLGKRLK